MATTSIPRDVGSRLRLSSAMLYAAVALSLAAGLVRIWVMPEYFADWWGYGTFFLLTAVAQTFLGVALLRLPRQPLLVLGIWVNLSIVALYICTRTAGVPFLGPRAWQAVPVGAADLATLSPSWRSSSR